MELIVASVCKTKDQALKSLEADYIKRLPSHLPIRILELGGEKFLKDDLSKQKKEHGKLLSKVPVQKNSLIIMDETGKHFTTEQLAQFIFKQQNSGIERLAFAIGGPSGFDQATKDSANTLISLSKLTLPYQLARLILIEQLYRSFTIHSNLPYHR